ncbi:MAG: YqaJ viral recombinase family protein [Bacteroidales bacterium]
MDAIKLVDTRTITREEWLNWRKKGIGGSDVSALLGLNPWRSPLALYYDKIGENEDEEESIAMELGKELEPFLRQKFEGWMLKNEGHVIEVEEEPFMMQHPEYEWALANIDGKFEHPEKGLCGLELKTTNEFARSLWQDDELPSYYYVQTQWYMAVTGIEIFYIGYLIGNRKFDAKEIPRNDEVIQEMLGQAKDFWHDHVLAKAPPAPIGLSSDTDTLKKLYPEEDGQVVELHEYQDKRDKYKELMKQKAELEKEIEAIKQQFMAAMGESEVAMVGDRKVTWKTVSRKGFTVKPSSSRQLRIY